MTDHKTTAPWVAVALLSAILCGYVATYNSMVRPEFVQIQDMTGAQRTFISPRYGHFDDDARGISARVFVPIHWLDRRIRPHVWEPTP